MNLTEVGTARLVFPTTCINTKWSTGHFIIKHDIFVLVSVTASSIDCPVVYTNIYILICIKEWNYKQRYNTDTRPITSHHSHSHSHGHSNTAQQFRTKRYKYCTRWLKTTIFFFHCLWSFIFIRKSRTMVSLLFIILSLKCVKNICIWIGLVSCSLAHSSSPDSTVELPYTFEFERWVMGVLCLWRAIRHSFRRRNGFNYIQFGLNGKYGDKSRFLHMDRHKYTLYNM